MKKIFLTIAIITTHFLVGQTSLFGVDLSKISNCNNKIIYRKIRCTKNPYYTIAEYKNFILKNTRLIVFNIEDTPHQNNQTEQAKKYTKKIGQEITKNLTNSTRFNINGDNNNEIQSQYYWVIKENDKFIVVKLFYSDFSHRNNLRVFFLKTHHELFVTLKYLTTMENTHHNTENYSSSTTKH
jgi:hypothetical protein